MADFDNTNTGALFKNDKKDTDKHPDYKGSINVDGVEYWLSAWLKISKAGNKFMSLSVQPKEQQQPPQRSTPTSRPTPSHDAAKARQLAGNRTADRSQPHHGGSGFDDMDDDVPFATSSMHYDMTTSKARKLARYDY